MADMYGAVCSNWFRVKDVAAFKAWFNESVSFGAWIEVFEKEGSNLAIGGCEMHPSAFPMIPTSDGDQGRWDLEEFATEMRKHLAEGHEFHVVTAGNEKLRYVAATHLGVTHSKVEFHDRYEGN